MQFISLLSFVLVSVGLAVGSPTELAPATDMKAKFCTDINYGGVCKTYTLRDDGCFNMSYEFDHQVSSLDPSIGVLATCDVYARPWCGGGIIYTVPYTGAPDLKKPGVNDKVSSVRCHAL